MMSKALTESQQPAVNELLEKYTDPELTELLRFAEFDRRAAEAVWRPVLAMDASSLIEETCPRYRYPDGVMMRPFAGELIPMKERVIRADQRGCVAVYLAAALSFSASKILETELKRRTQFKNRLEALNAQIQKADERGAVNVSALMRGPKRDKPDVGQATKMTFEIVTTKVWKPGVIETMADEFRALFVGNPEIASTLMKHETIDALSSDTESQ